MYLCLGLLWSRIRFCRSRRTSWLFRTLLLLWREYSTRGLMVGICLEVNKMHLKIFNKLFFLLIHIPLQPDVWYLWYFIRKYITLIWRNWLLSSNWNFIIATTPSGSKDLGIIKLKFEASVQCTLIYFNRHDVMLKSPLIYTDCNSRHTTEWTPVSKNL